MKISKRQLRRIIKEERATIVKEGMKELEAELIEDIVDLLIERGAINRATAYEDAAEYIKVAVLPTLQNMASTGGVWSEEEDYEAGFKR